MAGIAGARGIVEQIVTCRSSDGTTIACHRSGRGPELVVVHGTSGDHTSWSGVTALLSTHFTISAMDRRGRGASGDSVDYALEREIEDVVAVVQSLGVGVHLAGHSFGGACAAEAATRLGGLASLILYEGGPRPPGSRFIPDDLVLGLERSIAEGHREKALETFALSVAGLSPAELEALKRGPTWQTRVAAVHTIPRELRALNDYGTTMEKFQSLTVPTLLLFGGASMPRRRQWMETLAGLIPNAQAVELQGQGHVANQTAPHLLAAAIDSFISGLQK
jgi:pimeloyl-ACP methyl ester carboxylesterase